MSRIPVPTLIIRFIVVRVKICRQGLVAIWTIAGWGVALGAQVDGESVGSGIVEDDLVGCLENGPPSAEVRADKGA